MIGGMILIMVIGMIPFLNGIYGLLSCSDGFCFGMFSIESAVFSMITGAVITLLGIIVGSVILIRSRSKE